MKTNRKTKKWHPATLERFIEMKTKKVTEHKSLLLKNLLKTNMQLLRSLDVSNAVLF